MQVIHRQVFATESLQYSPKPVTFTRPHSVCISGPNNIRAFSPFRVSLDRKVNPVHIQIAHNSPQVIAQMRSNSKVCFGNKHLKENRTYFCPPRNNFTQTVGAGFRSFEYPQTYELAERKEIVIPMKKQFTPINKPQYNQDYFAQSPKPAARQPQHPLRYVQRVNQVPQPPQNIKKRADTKQSRLDLSIINKLDENSSMKQSTAFDN